MSKNKFKIDKRNPYKGSLFSALDRVIHVEHLFENGFPVKFLPHTLFVIGLTICYIGNSHNADRMVRKIDKLEVEVEDLRADYTTMKAAYMVASKQSEVAKRVKKIDLIESNHPPLKVEIETE